MAAPHRNADLGLLILRIGIGLYFFTYGLAKLLGGPERWEQTGAAMGHFGIGFWHSGWGFTAGLIECCGGILFALGLLFRPTCGVLAAIMVVACVAKGAGAVEAAAADGRTLGAIGVYMAVGHPASMLILFLSGVLIGPGALALDRRYRMTLTKRYAAPLPQGAPAARGSGE